MARGKGDWIDWVWRNSKVIRLLHTLESKAWPAVILAAVERALRQLPQRIGQACASPVSSPVDCVTKRAFEVTSNPVTLTLSFNPLASLCDTSGNYSPTWAKTDPTGRYTTSWTAP